MEKGFESRTIKCLLLSLLFSCSVVSLCDTVDCCPPGSSVQNSLQQEYQGGFPCPPPGFLPDPGIEAEFMSPALTGGFFTPGTTWKTHAYIQTHTMRYLVVRIKSDKTVSLQFCDPLSAPTFLKIFIWLHWVLVAAYRIFIPACWDLYFL